MAYPMFSRLLCSKKSKVGDGRDIKGCLPFENPLAEIEATNTLQEAAAT